MPMMSGTGSRRLVLLGVFTALGACNGLVGNDDIAYLASVPSDGSVPLDADADARADGGPSDGSTDAPVADAPDGASPCGSDAGLLLCDDFDRPRAATTFNFTSPSYGIVGINTTKTLNGTNLMRVYIPPHSGGSNVNCFGTASFTPTGSVALEFDMNDLDDGAGADAGGVAAQTVAYLLTEGIENIQMLVSPSGVVLQERYDNGAGGLFNAVGAGPLPVGWFRVRLVVHGPAKTAELFIGGTRTPLPLLGTMWPTRGLKVVDLGISGSANRPGTTDIVFDNASIHVEP